MVSDFLSQPTRARRRLAPAHKPRFNLMEGKSSFLGDTAVVR
jgi:hypothetical protein